MDLVELRSYQSIVLLDLCDVSRLVVPRLIQAKLQESLEIFEVEVIFQFVVLEALKRIVERNKASLITSHLSVQDSLANKLYYEINGLEETLELLLQGHGIHFSKGDRVRALASFTDLILLKHRKSNLTRWKIYDNDVPF